MALLPPLFSPLDEELSLLPGPLTPRLIEDLVHRGTWMPFGVAARTLGRFPGVAVSEASARRWTEKAGAARVAHETAEVERRVREEVPPPPGPPRQQVSVDGARVPVVGGAWSEVKTVAIGTGGERVWEQDHVAVHPHDVASFSRCAAALPFSHQASRETPRRGTPTAGTVRGSVDGADGEQRFLDDHRPDAGRLLEWGHAAEHLALAGQTRFGVGTDKVSAWRGTWLQELRHGNPEQVLTELRDQIGTAGEGTAREEAAKHLAYLAARREQIRYAAFEAHGFPIGSGMGESGNKLVIETRLKGAGMHWAPDHVNPLVARRAGACSDRWDETWPAIHRRLRRERPKQPPVRRGQRERGSLAPRTPPPARAISRAAALAGLPPAVPISLPDAARKRPAPDHPWRRALIPPDQRHPSRSHACTKS
jgi:hypothetical protein